MKFRKLLKITSRSSSITNCFVQAIIPNIDPSEEEYDEALSILDMSRSTLSCVYCGAPTTDWDHFRPLVRKRKPTGYISEIRNLVPSCGPCNQSKGGQDWRKWMTGSAKGSPKTRGVRELDVRIKRLEAFEAWGSLMPLPLEELADRHIWEMHWKRLDELHELLKLAQAHAIIVREKIAATIQEKGTKG